MFAFGQPKGDTVTVKGEVIDLWCYVESGDHGAKHKSCAISCANAGNPIGLLTDQGDIKDHHRARMCSLRRWTRRSPLGTLVEKGGVQVSYLSSVK
jgi:hypothetical protein